MDRRPDVWAALRIDFATASRINVFLRFLGRLKPGVSVQQAQTQVDGIVAHLKELLPINKTAGLRWRVEPMHEYLVASARPGVLALMGAVVFVLLIACANVANLLLVRSSERERELVVRAALGAGRSGADAAGAGGERRHRAGRRRARRGARVRRGGRAAAARPRPRCRGSTSRRSTCRVLVVAVLASLAAALAFGLVPALRASRADAGAALRAASRTGSLAAGKVLRNAVVVTEVALAFVLLVGSGLMIRSFLALQQTDPGFDPSGVLTFEAGPPGGPAFAQPEQRHAFMRELRSRFAALPGVTAVSAAFPLPLDGRQANARWGTEEAAGDPAKFQQADVHIVLPGYFEALRTRLLDGRTFTEDGRRSAADARDHRQPARRQGVPGPLRGGPAAPGARPRQRPGVGPGGRRGRAPAPRIPGRRRVARRCSSPTGSSATAARRAGSCASAASRSPSPPRCGGRWRPMRRTYRVSELQPMQALVAQAMAPTRFALLLIGIFAVIAAVLAAVGLYSVLATAVRQRTAEIGIRMTFGAEAPGIFRLIVGQGLRLSGIGDRHRARAPRSRRRA